MARVHRVWAAASPLVFLAPAVTWPALDAHAAARCAASQDDAATLRDFHSANGLLNRGMHDLAEQEYRKFLAAHPTHAKAPVARYGLAVALQRQNRIDEAAGELEPLIGLERVEFAAESCLLLGQCRMIQERYADAAAAFDVVVKRHAGHAQADAACALLVESHSRAAAHERAIEAAAVMAAKWTNSPRRERAEFFAGLSETALERHADAARRYEAMVRAFPDGELAARASLLHARALHAAEQWEAASAQYQRVIRRNDPAFAPEAMYSLAGLLRRDGKPRDAAALLDRVLKDHAEHPVIPLALLERGRVHYDAGEYDKAVSRFAEAVEADEALADSAAWWTARCELRQDQPGQAAARLEQAIARHPKSAMLAEMRYDRAVALHRAGDADAAQAALAEFRAAHPKHVLAPDALHLAAIIDHQRREYAASDALGREFIEKHAKHALLPAIEFLMAENAFLSGNHREAAARFEKFIASRPGDGQVAAARYRLGTAYVRLNDPRRAEEHLRAVVNGAKTPAAYRSALLDLADIHFARQEWEPAEARASEYLSADENAPDADDALITIGLCRQRRDLHETALQAFERLLERHPSSPHAAQANFERGQSLVVLGRDDDAVEVLQRVLESREASRFAAHALNHLGAIAMRGKRYDEAATHYAKLAGLDAPEELKHEALFQQGQALMAQSKYDEAGRAFARFVEQAPGHARAPMASANVALCAARGGDHAGALKQIDRVLREQARSLDDQVTTSLLYEKAWSQRETGDVQGASATYRAMLGDQREHSLDLFARVELAELEAGAGGHDAAVALLEPIAERADLPGDLGERSGYRLGACLYELGRDEAAARAFEAFLKSHAKSSLAPSARLLAGEAHFRRGQHRQAAAHLARAAESEEARLRAPALLRLGEAHAALQAWKESEQAFSRFLREFPESEVWFQARFGLGFAMENQGRFDEAITSYRTVIEKHEGPTAARSQFQIGECLYAQKKYDEAARELLKVDILYAYPEWSAAALYEAGRCFEAMAQVGQARQQFEAVRDQHAGTRWAELATARLAALSKPDLPGRGGGSGGGR